MKRLRKPLLIIALTLALCFGTVSPAYASGLRTWIDGYLLPEIPRPRGGASYEAELKVVTQNGEVTLKGTCTAEGDLKDQDVAQAVWDAVDAFDEYDSISEAAEDQKDVADLTKELKSDLENAGHILNNFFKCAGIDKVTDLLQGKLPSYSWDDIVKMAIDTFKGSSPGQVLSPVPLGLNDAVSGAIIGTAKVSWAEYQNDKKRWADIVELTNAKARLRTFDGIVKSKLRKLAEKNMVWTIRIQDEFSQEVLYDQLLDAKAPMIHMADIVLKKTGDANSPYGTYSGSVRYEGKVDLKEYDNMLPTYYAKFWDGNTGASAYLGSFTGVGKTINRPSENKLLLEQVDFSCDMKKEDILGGFIEKNINTGEMEVKEFRVLHDYAVTVMRKEPSGTTTVTQTNLLDSETGTDYKSWLIHYVTATGESHDTTEEDSEAYPDTDPRKLVKLRLVIKIK